MHGVLQDPTGVTSGDPVEVDEVHDAVHKVHVLLVEPRLKR